MRRGGRRCWVSTTATTRRGGTVTDLTSSTSASFTYSGRTRRPRVDCAGARPFHHRDLEQRLHALIDARVISRSRHGSRRIASVADYGVLLLRVSQNAEDTEAVQASSAISIRVEEAHAVSGPVRLARKGAGAVSAGRAGDPDAQDRRSPGFVRGETMIGLDADRVNVHAALHEITDGRRRRASSRVAIERRVKASWTGTSRSSASWAPVSRASEGSSPSDSAAVSRLDASIEELTGHRAGAVSAWARPSSEPGGLGHLQDRCGPPAVIALGGGSGA
jgi:hypothetical protein